MNVKFFITVVIMSVMSILTACSDKVDETRLAASECYDKSDYDGALARILALDDETILSSDTLQSLLFSSYYGANSACIATDAKDCCDLDVLPSGKEIALTDFLGQRILFYSLPDLKHVRDIKLSSMPFAIAFSPDGDRIAVAQEDETVAIIDATDGRKLKQLTGHTARVRDVAWKTDTVLYSAGNDQMLIGWNLATGAKIYEGHIHSRNVKAIDANAQAGKLASCSNDGYYRLYDISGSDKPRDTGSAKVGDNYINDVALSRAGNRAAAVSGDGNVHIADVSTNKPVAVYSLDDAMTSAAFLPGDSLAIVAGRHDAFIIDVNRENIKGKIPLRGIAAWGAAVTPDGRYLIADGSHLFSGMLLQGKQLLDKAREYLSSLPVPKN